MTELHDLIAAFAAIGATEDGGVCRLTATPSDKAARDLFRREIGNRGLLPRIDPIGNMFGVAVLAPAIEGCRDRRLSSRLPADGRPL